MKEGRKEELKQLGADVRMIFKWSLKIRLAGMDWILLVHTSSVQWT